LGAGEHRCENQRDESGYFISSHSGFAQSSFDPTLAWKVLLNNSENARRLTLGNDNSVTKDLRGDADSEK